MFNGRGGNRGGSAGSQGGLRGGREVASIPGTRTLLGCGSGPASSWIHPIWLRLGGPVQASRAESEAGRMARLEAVLFLAKEPLSSRKLSEYANLADGTEARTLVTRLNRRLDEAGRAFRVEQVAGGYQMVTRPKFAEWLRRLSHVPGALTLSPPAMETLAVVAYCQPLPRAEVEAIRGVSCGELLSQLLERDLIRVAGRSEELGRPYLYQTTKRFLQLFGLRTLEDLPKSDTWRRPRAGQPPLPEIPQVSQNPAEQDQAATKNMVSNQEESTVTRHMNEFEIEDPASVGLIVGAASLGLRAKKDEDFEEEEEDEEFLDDDEDDDFEDDDEDDDFDEEDDDFEDEEDEEEAEEEEFFEEEEEEEEEADEEELDEEEDEWEEVEDEEVEEEEEEEEDWEEDDDEDWDDDEEEDWE